MAKKGRPKVKNCRLYQALLKKGYSKESAARIANAMGGRGRRGKRRK